MWLRLFERILKVWKDSGDLGPSDAQGDAGDDLPAVKRQVSNVSSQTPGVAYPIADRLPQSSIMANSNLGFMV